MKNFSNYTDYDRKENLHFESKAVHGALGHDPFSGSVSFPIYQTATFRHKGLFESTGFDYSRLANPTRLELERTMAILENGYAAYAFSSGQAANTAVFTMLDPGDEVILEDDIYGGTFRLGEDIYKRYGITFRYVDMTDPSNIEKAINEHTKIIYLETPTNPMMNVCDMEAVGKVAHAHNCLFVVDNTLMSPYFQKPINFGADIVVHSATKFIGGHHDALAGFVVVTTEELSKAMQAQIKTFGAMLDPQESWLLIRGLKTLPLRMDKADQNTRVIADWLRKQEKVTAVYYAGFQDHPGYEIMKKQSTGFSPMLSFDVDSFATVKKILKRVDLIYFAESLGGCETLLTYPKTQTHESIPIDIQQRLGIKDTTIRMSVGIENVEDLIADLDQAINGPEVE